MSSGPAQAAPGGAQFVTDTTSSGPDATAEAASASAGGDSNFVDSTAGEATLAGGLMLLVLGAGFVATRRGGETPKPA